MRGVAAFVLLGLVACATADGATPDGASSELRQWQTMAGKPPSESELAAVVAACEDREKNPHDRGPIEECLADLGLRRVQ